MKPRGWSVNEAREYVAEKTDAELQEMLDRDLSTRLRRFAEAEIAAREAVA